MRITDVYAFQRTSGEFLRQDGPLLRQAVNHCVEEVQELQEAYTKLQRLADDENATDEEKENAVVEILDAVIDLRYVAVNVAYFMGCPPETLIAGSVEVHEANMAKLFPKPVRNADGKIVKPAGWKPPTHRAIRAWLRGEIE